MKTKIIFLIIIFSFAGLFAQQKAKLQKMDESGFIEVDEVPVLKSQLKPAYPDVAKLAGIEGTVYLKLLIDEKGNVAKAKVEQGAKEMLDNSALKAAKEAKFSPAMSDNKPVKVWVILPVAFKLDVEKSAGKLMKYDELGQTQ
jgi:TonB family protein